MDGMCLKLVDRFRTCYETGMWWWKKTHCMSTVDSWFEIKNVSKCALHEGQFVASLRVRSGADFELGREYFGEWLIGDNRGRLRCFPDTERISIAITAREGDANFVLYGCPEEGERTVPERGPTK